MQAQKSRNLGKMNREPSEQTTAYHGRHYVHRQEVQAMVNFATAPAVHLHCMLKLDNNTPPEKLFNHSSEKAHKSSQMGKSFGFKMSRKRKLVILSSPHLKLHKHIFILPDNLVYDGIRLQQRAELR